MTFFIVVCMVIFLFSLSSNMFFVLTSEENRIGGILGMIVFTAMIIWSIQLLVGG